MIKKFITALGIISLILGLTTLAEAGKVYLLSGADSGQDTAIKTTLEGFGHQVTIGVEHQDFDGSQSLSGYDVVIFLDSNNFGPTADGQSRDMPEPGQVALLKFILSGGGLITGEWVTYDNYQTPQYFTILGVALPGTCTGEVVFQSPLTYTTVTPDSTLNYRVPSPLTFKVTDYEGTESVLLLKTGATAFYGSSGGGAGLLGWTYGSGKVLSFSTPIGPDELSNTDYQQLLNNSVKWTSKRSSLGAILLLLLD